MEDIGDMRALKIASVISAFRRPFSHPVNVSADNRVRVEGNLDSISASAPGRGMSVYLSRV